VDHQVADHPTDHLAAADHPAVADHPAAADHPV
jgi:hypothetical protein